MLTKERMKQKQELLDEKEISWLRGVGGSLLWVGKEGRPDVGAACAMSMSWPSTGPTVEHILMANKTVAELKQTMDACVRITPIPAEESICKLQMPPRRTWRTNRRVASFWPWLTRPS